MKSQTKPIEFDEFLTNIPSIFEQIEREGTEVLVEHEGELFSLKKVSKSTRPKTKSSKRSRGITPQDSIFNIIGIGSSEEPTDIARYKHDYLAEIYGDLHKE